MQKQKNKKHPRVSYNHESKNVGIGITILLSRNIKKRLKTLIIGLYVILFTSFSWLISIWFRYGISDQLKTMEHMMDDLKWMGPVALIVDVIFFFFVYKLIWPGKSIVKSENSPPINGNTVDDE